MAKHMPCKISITLPITPESPHGNVRTLSLVSCKGGGQYLNDLGDRLELHGKGIILHIHEWGVQEPDGIPRLFDFHGEIIIRGAE